MDEMEPGAGEEEVLDTRPGGRRRRFALTAGIVLLAAVVIAGLVAARGRSGHHHAGPTPNPSPSHTAAPDLAAVEPSAGDAIGDTLYVVEAGALATVDVNTGRSFVWHRVGPDDGATEYRVIADGAHHQVFVVSSGGDSTAVAWFDSGTLVEPGEAAVPGRLGGAALLDGRLYVSTSTGVVAIGQEPATAPYGPTAIRGGQAVTADPSRHRLLVTHLDGVQADVEAHRPDRAGAQAAAPVPFMKGDVVVVDGRIWAVGFAENGAVIARLDSETLRAAARSPLETQLGPGAVVAAVGVHHFLLRDGGGGSGLWCLDASGAVRRSWPAVTGTPVLTSSGVYVLAAGRPLQHLNSAGCSS
jgi:hypothetical protein